MAIRFYRKKTAGQPDAFYESGTDRYIGPKEFGKGAGFKETAPKVQKTVVSPGQTPSPVLQENKELEAKPTIPTPPTAPVPTPTSKPTDLKDNPILKYIEEQVVAPARKSYEELYAE